MALRRRLEAHPGAVADGLAIAGMALLANLLFATGGYGFDAYAYWAVDPADPYRGGPGFGAFHYAPIFAQLIAPFHSLPFQAFFWLWTVVGIGSLLLMGRRWGLAFLAFPPVAIEIYHGNVHLLMAVALWVGLRWPAAWSFLVLTKVTPGVVLIWYAVRREWRSLVIALAATFALGLASLIVAPGLWSDWLGHLGTAQYGPNLTANAVALPLLLRLPLAVLIVVVGARTSRAWALPFAATIALPLLWIHGLALLIAAIPLARWKPTAPWERHVSHHAPQAVASATL